MTFDEFWKHYVGGDKDKSLETGRIYAASAWDYQQARIQALEKALRTIMNMGFESCREEHRIARKALQEPTND